MLMRKLTVRSAATKTRGLSGVARRRVRAPLSRSWSWLVGRMMMPVIPTTRQAQAGSVASMKPRPPN